jgi:hypothetical protein
MEANRQTFTENNQQQPYLFKYSGCIIHWELEEGVWYSKDLVEAELAQLEREAGKQMHGLLVNASFNAVINLECMEQLISCASPFRKAIAIVTGDNLATYLMIKFYLSNLSEDQPVKFFRSEEQAKGWLIDCNMEKY